MPRPATTALRQRHALLPDRAAAYVLGVTRETVVLWAQEGTLCFVYDLGASDAARAEFRFWLGELLRVKDGLPRPSATPREAAEQITGYPAEQWLRSETVARVLNTGRRMVHTWLERGELAGERASKADGRARVERASVIYFLLRRQVGGVTPLLPAVGLPDAIREA